MNRRHWPLLTLGLAGVCVAAELFGGVQSFAYQRSLVGEAPWRLVTAAFAHFDGRHLASNLAALVVLGMALEAQWGSVRLMVLTALTLVASIGVLHVALDHYAAYAGFSAISYAWFGAWIGTLARRRPVPAGLGLAGLGIVLGMGWTGVALVPVAGTVPAWEVHLLGAALGLSAGWMGQSSRVGRSSARSQPHQVLPLSR